MKKRAILPVFTIFIGISVLLLTGFARQGQAAMLQQELTGTVEKKIRSAESAQALYIEPGTPISRADRATAIIVDGSRMFILPETIIKKNDVPIINFDEVAVPCQAKIVYQQLPNGGKNVLELHILSESARASKKWAPPEPQ